VNDDDITNDGWPMALPSTKDSRRSWIVARDMPVAIR